MLAFDTEVLCQIDYFHIFRDGVLLKECLALTVTETEEYNIYLIKRHLVSKLQI